MSAYGATSVTRPLRGICATTRPEGSIDAVRPVSVVLEEAAADIERNDQALAPRVKGVLARLYGRKPSALDAPDVPLDIVGTAFQWKVWKALTEIPSGETRTVTVQGLQQTAQSCTNT